MNTKDYKLHLTILFVSLILALVSGCQKTPEQGIVTSKNDGSLESAIYDGAKQTENVTPPAQKTHTYHESLLSAGGDVSFSIDLEEPDVVENIPVIRAVPHSFTSEEAKQFAQALFQDENILENAFEDTAILDKKDIEEKILQLKQHIGDRAALVAYYSGNEDIADRVTAEYESQIERYEQLYETAPESVEETLCDWVFHPQSYYDDPGSDYASEEDGYDGLQCIKAKINAENDEYCFNVYNRAESDYQTHYIHMYMKEEDVSSAELYSSEEPTADIIADHISQAEDMLDRMDIGDWVIRSVDPMEWEDYLTGMILYKTEIYACPAFSSIAVLDQGTMRLGTEADYAPVYPKTLIRFVFSGDKLMAFEYTSPIDIVRVENDDVQLMPFDTVMEKLKTYLRTFEADTLSQNIHVKRAELAFSCVQIKDRTFEFYLVPSYAFYVSIPVGPSEQNEPEMADVPTPLVVINAVDGSII